MFCSTKLVVGPLLFIAYMVDLAAIAQKHNIMAHAFADDTQMYLYCSRDNTMSTAVHFECWITDVSHWMSTNYLKLNTDKTKLLWVRSCAATWS